MIRGFFLTSDLLHRLLSQQNLRRRRPSQHNLQKIHELRWVNLPQVVWPIPLMLQLLRLWTTNRHHRAQSSIWKRTTTPHRVMLIKNKTMEKNQSKWKIVFVMIFQRWLQVLYRQGSLQQLIHLHCGRFLTPKNMRGFRCLLPSGKTPMVVIHFWVQLHVTKILLTSKVGWSRTSKSKWPMLRFFKKHWPVKSGKTMLPSGPVVTTRIAMEATYYENFTIDSPDVDSEVEVSQWIRFVQKFAKHDKLASGGPTLGFINNIKDAMPRHLHDFPDALDKYRIEFPDRDMCFTLLKEVSADAKLFETWIKDQDYGYHLSLTWLAVNYQLLSKFNLT